MALGGRISMVRRTFTLGVQKNDVINSTLYEVELMEYTRSRERLARIMGADQATFSDDDMKHPSKYLYQESRDVYLDEFDRPINSGFFTGSPAYHELKFQVYKLLENVSDGQHAQLGPIPSSNKSFKWIKKEEMEDLLSEDLSSEKYESLIALLTLLVKFESNFTVMELLKKYRTASSSLPVQMSKYKHSDKPIGLGRRKTALAEVKIYKGLGKFVINSRTLFQYFPHFEDRQQVLFPLHITKTLGQVDVDCSVSGGGMTGQAGAVRLGLSKALASYPGVLVDDLINSGLLVSDTRRVERKKPGQMKARRKFAWVKR